MSNNQFQDYSIESSNLQAKRRPSENSNGYLGKGWRKYSGSSKNSFDSSYKGGSGYPNRKKRRERFNSEGNSKWGSNHYIFGFKSQFEEIEIDISKIKYSLNLNYKYPLDTIQQLYNKMKENKTLDNKPTFIKNEEIIGDKPKEIAIFCSTNSGENNQKLKDISNISEQMNQGNTIPNITNKLPKNNPLCNMPKNFNKFDMVPQNFTLNPDIKNVDFEKKSENKVEETKKEEKIVENKNQ